MNTPISPKQNPTNNPYFKFLNSLDKFQSEEYLTFKQCNTIHRTTQNHYQNFFTPYENIEGDYSSYVKWQTEHEMNLDALERIKVHRVGPKEKIHIDSNINSLKDLLNIIEKYTYETNKEYNIDLLALHKIKTELKQLESMIGLESLKTCILKQLLYFIQGFAEDTKNGDYKHTVLTGPPGTGKTEIAKLMGVMYSKIGILKNNTFKKVTRTDLIAGYLGQTAIKTRKVIDECIGGVLFIDEAYSLQPDDMYAKECVDTLCEALSDHKKDFMVIIAGYQKNLQDTFFKINTGLNSRFIWRFNIEEYTHNELYSIFKQMVIDREWHTEDSKITVKWFQDKEFKDNGRSMEQLFLLTKIAHSKRIYGKDSSMKKKINLEDLQEGYKMFQENMKTNNNNMLFGLYI